MLVNTVSRERIEDTLGLMRKPKDSLIDSSLGREICLRDVGIHAMLRGSIEKLDAGYIFNLEVLDPETNQSLAASSWEAGDQEQILDVVHESSEWVRTQLGDKWVSSGEYPSRLRRFIDPITGDETWEQLPLTKEGMERVTTRSLEALQLYTEGVKAYQEQANKKKAELLFRKAVAQDPEFASA